MRSLAVSMEALSLPKNFVIAAKGRSIEYVYFLTSGIGSVDITTASGSMAEAGMFGREGFSPTSAAVGGEVSLFDIVMQSDGDGYRIGLHGLRSALGGDRHLERILARYIYVFAAQASYTALANAAYKINARVARWLLMCHDRVPIDDFQLTHDEVALALAVRRSSVTDALHELEGEGLIRATRGHVAIRDRKALEEFAGEAYGGPESEYNRLLTAPSR